MIRDRVRSSPAPIALALAFAFAIAGVGASAAPAPLDAEAVAAWRSDLALLREQLPALHPAPFTLRSAEAFFADLDALDADLPRLDADVALLRLAGAVAALGDAHTFVDLGPLVTPPLLPLRIGVMPEGAIVLAADDARADLLGGRVVAIGGVPFEEVAARLGAVVPAETPGWRDRQLTRLLVAPRLLVAAGLAEAGAPLRLAVATDSGATIERTIEPGTATGPLRFAFDVALAPRFLQRGPAYDFERLEEAPNVLYVRYASCRDDPARPFAAFLAEIEALLDGGEIDRVVVDLRGNGGGNSRVLEPLVNALARRPALDRPDRLFVLIDAGVFSSAVMNAMHFRQRTRATLVGEPTGGRPNHFGEVRSFSLPATGVVLRHSTKRFVMIADADPPAVRPDRLVPFRFADLRAGRDPALAAALAPAAPASPSASEPTP